MRYYNLPKFDIFGIKEVTNINDDYKIFYTNDESNIFVFAMKINDKIKTCLNNPENQLFRKFLNLRNNFQKFLGYYIYNGEYYLIFEFLKTNIFNILENHIKNKVKINELFILNYYYSMMKVSYMFYKIKVNFCIKSLENIYINDNNEFKLINPIINNYFTNLKMNINNNELNEYNLKENLKNIKNMGMCLIFLKNDYNSIDISKYFKLNYSANFFIKIKTFNNTNYEKLKIFLKNLYTSNEEQKNDEILEKNLYNKNIFNKDISKSKIKIFDNSMNEKNSRIKSRVDIKNKQYQTYLDIKPLVLNKSKLNKTEFKENYINLKPKDQDIQKLNKTEFKDIPSNMKPLGLDRPLLDNNKPNINESKLDKTLLKDDDKNSIKSKILESYYEFKNN